MATKRTPDQTFGKSVREFREDLGWSMTEFAEKLATAGLTHFHPTTVSRMERGERPVRLNEAVVIAKVLNASMDELAEGFEVVGDEELKDAQEFMRRAGKQAAVKMLHLTLHQYLAQDAVDAAREALLNGEIPEEHVQAVEDACKATEAMIEKDLVQYWQQELAALSDEERDELFKSDREWTV